MPKFYKYNIEDLKFLQKNVCDYKAVDEFRNRHFYYTCSCCHKEELYVESPVVKDELWKETLEKLGIENNEHISKAIVFRYPAEKQYWPAIRFYRLFNEINEVTPDDSYVMLCRECVEKGIGRELYIEDLVDCDMTKTIAHKFKSGKIKNH